MTEPHPGTQLDQPGSFSRDEGIAADPEIVGRSEQQGHIADGLGRGDEQQLLAFGGERRDP
ncbi:MAG: hypothetical protein ACLP0J_22645 [Solirubrobacteraceae bacterium]